MADQRNPAVRVIAGSLFALFIAFVAAALTVFGVVNVTIGHFFMLAAAAIGTIIIFKEIIPNKRRQQKVLWSLLLSLGLLAADFEIVRNKKVASSSAAPVRSALSGNPIVQESDSSSCSDVIAGGNATIDCPPSPGEKSAPSHSSTSH